MKKLLLLLFIPLFFSCGNNKKDVDLNAINPLEIDIKKPDGWYSLDVDLSKQIENLNRAEFNKDQIDKIIQNSQGNLPLFSYTKYDTDSLVGPTPTINVVLNKNPSSNFQGFKDICENSMVQFQDMFDNFEMTSPIQEIDIAGIKSVSCVATYDFSFDGSIYKTRVWIYAVPLDGYSYQINFIDFIELDDCSIIYNDVLKSIIIGKN
jgi:hypothetical protein